MRRYKEDNILKFIKEYMKEHGYAPSISEIGEAFGLKSKASTHYYFALLIERGDIIMDKNGKRYTVKGMKYVEC